MAKRGALSSGWLAEDIREVAVYASSNQLHLISEDAAKLLNHLSFQPYTSQSLTDQLNEHREAEVSNPQRYDNSMG